MFKATTLKIYCYVQEYEAAKNFCVQYNLQGSQDQLVQDWDRKIFPRPGPRTAFFEAETGKVRDQDRDRKKKDNIIDLFNLLLLLLDITPVADKTDPNTGSPRLTTLIRSWDAV